MFCKHCSTPKDGDAFYKSNPAKCKDCIKSAVRKHRLENIEKFRAYDRMRASMPHRIANAARAFEKWKFEHPERRAANVAVGNAVRDGRLEKWPCQVCGFKAVAHHPDYSRPLEVVWLCQAHHKQAHALIESTS